MSTPRYEIAFLFDVDITLLDNDRVIDDLQSHLEHEIGPERARCYWAIFEELRTELGYADYLGALQRCRGEYPRDPGILLGAAAATGSSVVYLLAGTIALQNMLEGFASYHEMHKSAGSKLQLAR